MIRALTFDIVLQIAAAEEATAATGEAASGAAVGSVAETAEATVAAEDTAVAATKWEEGQYLRVQYGWHPPDGATAQSFKYRYTWLPRTTTLQLLKALRVLFCISSLFYCITLL